jgi:uncharacterized protein (TIGR02453 family)
MINKKLLTFLKGIKANNEQAWYEAHKAEYQTLRAEFTEWLVSLETHIAQFDKAVAAGIKKGNQTHKVFRIHRDARFSHDKTKYKTNISGYISADVTSEFEPVYYVSIEPGNSFIGGGLHTPERQFLGVIRDAIHAKPESFKKIESDPAFIQTFPNLIERSNSLKTAPRGFETTDPAIEYLRLSSFTAHAKLRDNDITSAELTTRICSDFATLLPLNQFLRSIKK